MQMEWRKGIVPVTSRFSVMVNVKQKVTAGGDRSERPTHDDPALIAGPPVEEDA